MNSTLTAPERRELFRRIVRQLDGSGKPEDALSDGLVLPRPDGLLERLVGSLEIRQHGSHLLFGTIGSGKTTVLLQLQKHLRRTGVQVEYLDVGKLGDIDTPWDDDPLFQFLEQTLVERFPDPCEVLLLDGCDRRDPNTFSETLSKLLPRFVAMRVGLVVVGPPSLQAVPPSMEEDWVDQHHICGTIDITTPTGRAFLDDVVHRRAGDIFDDESKELLRELSGGVLRDMLLVARQAVESAYIAGRSGVTSAEVTEAARHLGASLLRGINAAELGTLGSYLKRAPGPEAELSELQRFVLQRWLIPTGGTPTVYVPHPCIVPFLAKAS